MSPSLGIYTMLGVCMFRILPFISMNMSIGRYTRALEYDTTILEVSCFSGFSWPQFYVKILPSMLMINGSLANHTWLVDGSSSPCLLSLKFQDLSCKFWAFFSSWALEKSHPMIHSCYTEQPHLWVWFLAVCMIDRLLPLTCRRFFLSFGAGLLFNSQF